jgi:hypothetical protein
MATGMRAGDVVKALASVITAVVCETSGNRATAHAIVASLTEEMIVAANRAQRPIPSKPAPTATSTPNGADQFSAEAEAKVHCPADTVVWANIESQICNFSGSKDYGKTKFGIYMCEKDTAAAGIRAAKNEKHP